MSDTLPFPVIMTTQGAQPTPPQTLRDTLVAIAVASDPGLTTNLPGTLIEDIVSSCTGSNVVVDQARVDLINSLTPFAANAWLLTQLGNIYDVPIGGPSNTSVDVVFTVSPAMGYFIAPGFTVSDGTYQYVLTDGGATDTGGVSMPLNAIANTSGSWVVPPGTVDQLVTSVPTGITLTVTNPLAGTPGIPGGETEQEYRPRVITAGKAPAQGTQSLAKTLIGAVPGVQPRLVSIRQLSSQWEVLVGGGDPYQVAGAIYQSGIDLSLLVGSTMNVTAITNANPGVVTTGLNHGLTTGNVVVITGTTGISGINGVPLTITVIDEKNFSTGTNTTSSGTYTGGGVVTPNFRNILVAINDYPDTYTIPIVLPPQQTVTLSLLWNTTSIAPVSNTAMQAAATTPLINYINGIIVGQPINIFELNAVFQQATQPILDNNLLTRLAWTVTINGITTAPSSGTGEVIGDPESYFFITNAGITIAQG